MPDIISWVGSFLMYHEYVGAGDPSASQQNVTFPPSIRSASLGSRVINGVSDERQHRQAKLVKISLQIFKKYITKHRNLSKALYTSTVKR